MDTEASHAIESLDLARDVGKAVQLGGLRFKCFITSRQRNRLPVTSASRSCGGVVGGESVRSAKSSL
jgi:hypothetical protein